MLNTDGWEAVTPEGLAAHLLGVAILFTVLCVAFVSLIMWLRYTEKCLGIEDWLMVIGALLKLVHNAIVMYGSVTGIGTPNSNLTAAQKSEAAKVILFWQLFYVGGSVFIKSSICTTLIRITIHRRYIWVLRFLILVSVLTTIMAMTVVLVRCKPIAASWEPTLGTCVSQDLIVVFTYIVSVVNIITDWTVSTIPIFILWHVQMQWKMKFLTWAALGLGFSSVATIIRMPSSSAYGEPTNLFYNIGHIIIWTVVECGLGVIAGCLPMLRKLLRGLASDPSSPKRGSHRIGRDLVTIGRAKGRHHPIHDTVIDVTIVAAGDTDGRSDGESTHRIIRVTRGVEQSHSESDVQISK